MRPRPLYHSALLFAIFWCLSPFLELASIQYAKYRMGKQMKQLAKSIHAEWISFSAEDYQNLPNKKEFKLRGEWYDVISTEIGTHTVSLKVIKDALEKSFEEIGRALSHSDHLSFSHSFKIQDLHPFFQSFSLGIRHFFVYFYSFNSPLQNPYFAKPFKPPCNCIS